MAHFDIVLDTNVLYAGLYSRQGASYQLLRRIGGEQFSMHISVPLLFEYEAVLKEHVLDFGLELTDIDVLVDYWCSQAHTHELYYSWRPLLRDPGDEMVLELAVASNCEFVVTHNMKHFKHVKGFRFRAKRPGEFLGMVEG